MKKYLIVTANKQLSAGVSTLISRGQGLALSCPDVPTALISFANEKLDGILLDGSITPDLANDLRKCGKIWTGCGMIVVGVKTPNFAQWIGNPVVDCFAPIPQAPEEVTNIAGALERCANGARRVLLVEDSRTFVALARLALERANYVVTACMSMEEALAYYPALRVDCLVTDIFMDGLGGVQGIAIARASRPTLPVIAMSGGLAERMSKDETLRAALKVGASSTLAKPFSPGDLLAAVETAVGKAA